MNEQCWYRRRIGVTTTNARLGGSNLPIQDRHPIARSAQSCAQSSAWRSVEMRGFQCKTILQELNDLKGRSWDQASARKPARQGISYQLIYTDMLRQTSSSPTRPRLSTHPLPLHVAGAQAQLVLPAAVVVPLGPSFKPSSL